MFVNMIDMLQRARQEGYGIVAPNIFDENTARSAIAVAARKQSPVILDLAFRAETDLRMLCDVVRHEAEKVSVPVSLNLDHGKTFQHCMLAIQAGFPSIMADRSNLPFEENVKQVAELAKIAHSMGVSIEAELGHVGMASSYEDDRDAGLTTVSEAREFVERTGVDCLAIAIGTAHGAYAKGVEPKLDFDRLQQLRAEVDIPLVLHGSSGSGDEKLAKAARLGITKFNIGTDNFDAGKRKVMEEGVKRGRDLVPVYLQGYEESIAHFMDLLGCSGKA